MLYSILIYGDEDQVAKWTPEAEQQLMDRHAELQQDLEAKGLLGPVMRLNRNGTRIVRKHKDRRYITDGPFAESKEQLMGIYVIDCPSFEDAIAATERLDFPTGIFEIRPLVTLEPGVIPRGKFPTRCPVPTPSDRVDE
jgi:hypothetical protein